MTIIRTTKKQAFTSTNLFEQKFGYYRAVRRGPFIVVSGTTALAEHPSASSSVEHAGDANKQAVLAMQRCVNAVTELGGRIEDIIRVKMFVANHDDCAAVGEAFKEVFGKVNVTAETREGDETSVGDDEDFIGAAATMIVVPGGFVDEDMLVEVEVDAYVVE